MSLGTQAGYHKRKRVNEKQFLTIKTHAPPLRFQSLSNQLKKQNKKDLLQVL